MFSKGWNPAWPFLPSHGTPHGPLSQGLEKRIFPFLALETAAARRA
jgi:hypothetical protein